jgi:hypothetical protein
MHNPWIAEQFKAEERATRVRVLTGMPMPFLLEAPELLAENNIGPLGDAYREAYAARHRDEGLAMEVFIGSQALWLINSDSTLQRHVARTMEAGLVTVRLVRDDALPPESTAGTIVRERMFCAEYSDGASPTTAIIASAERPGMRVATDNDIAQFTEAIDTAAANAHAATDTKHFLRSRWG